MLIFYITCVLTYAYIMYVMSILCMFIMYTIYIYNI